MNKTRHHLLATVVLVLAATTGLAQTHREEVRARVDSLLSAKYNKVTYDTNYIRRPSTKLTLKFRTNVSGMRLKTEGEVYDIPMKSNLRTDHKATVSVGATYQGISMGLAVNPAKLSGRSQDYEINVNMYNNHYAVDASYQMSKTLSGESHWGDDFITTPRGRIHTKVLNLSGYYVFNNKRFSYPAAFTQSYIQKRSAGSWQVGFSYQGGSYKTSDDAPDDVVKYRIYSGHFGLGGGYGYNWVPSRNWLLHLSFIPTLIIANNNNMTVNGEREDMNTRFPDVILNGHVAIVRNFSSRYFSGMTAYVNETMFGDNKLDFYQRKWRVRLFFGMRM